MSDEQSPAEATKPKPAGKAGKSGKSVAKGKAKKAPSQPGSAKAVAAKSVAAKAKDVPKSKDAVKAKDAGKTKSAKKAKPTRKTGGAGKKDGGNKPTSERTGRALVIVESPAKAKTIKKYLGRGFTVKASVGHVKDLPKSKLSVDIDNGFAPKYEIIRGKSKVIKEIKDAARTVDIVYLAPDPDREGEAIAWHLAEELGTRHGAKIRRITFNEITKNAVQQAIAEPRDIDQHRFESQQARRILDRIVGYQISPILWDKVRRGLSAGRVQSVAVRLIVDREKEIAAFKAEEYWTVDCLLHGKSPPPFLAKVIKKGEDKFRPTSKDEAMAAVRDLEGASYVVSEVIRRERRRRPSAPFITSKLQQEAAGRLRYTAKRTMMIAQQLYEGVELGDEGSVGLITYMRTDSTRVANEAIVAVREHIGKKFGAEYLPAEPNTYKSKKSAQEAHEAIRPTSMEYPPERVRPFLSPEQFRLYRLIWQWFVSSQMTPAVFDQTAVDIKAGVYGLRANGSIMKFPGFLAAQEVDPEVPAAAPEAPVREATTTEEGSDAEAESAGGSVQLPPLEQGDSLDKRQVTPEQHFTQPPPRFSESTLVKELEEDGIGRPSTYAAILSTIVSRGYVKKEEGRFHPSELGTLITELLLVSFPKILDVGFTADMEEKLDEVENGTVDWVNLLSTFYFGGFKDDLARAAVEMRDVKREEIPTDLVCEKCGAPMIIRWGKNGSFLACKGYPKCRNTRDYERLADGSLHILPEQTTDLLCPKCTGPMVVKRGRYGQFLACKNYPECKGTRPVSIGVDCPNKCGGYIAERRSMRGRVFYGCSSYPNCTFASWDRPVPGPCPACGHVYLIRRYRKADGFRIKCPNKEKECLYERDPELDDADQKAVAAAE